MKITARLLFFCATALTLAAAEPEFALQVLPHVEPAPAPQYFVSGAAAKVRLAIEAPLGTRVSVTGDLLQLGESLAAPVSKDLTLAGEVAFIERTRAVIEAGLPLPEVARTTRFLVKLRVQAAGEEKPRPAGQILLVVYPAGHLDAFRKFLAARAADGPPILGVFGASPALRSFLSQERIPFTDLGAEFPSSLNRKLIHIGEGSMEKLAPRFPEETHAIIFDRDSGALPGVYPAPRRTGLLVKVTLPILDSLATDPHAQETFARLFYQSLPDPQP